MICGPIAMHTKFQLNKCVIIQLILSASVEYGQKKKTFKWIEVA